jgi:hypothetical protein
VTRQLSIRYPPPEAYLNISTRWPSLVATHASSLSTRVLEPSFGVGMARLSVAITT